MAHLAGRFAGVLLVQVQPERVDALSMALERLDAHGMKVVVERCSEAARPEGYRPLRVELVGQDRSGIIRDISRCLAERGVNVEELTTACEEAPMAGGELFRMIALVSTPPGVAAADLTAALEGLANDLMVDISVRDE